MRIISQLGFTILCAITLSAQPPINGAGLLAHGAVACVDRDGDGYGVGPVVVVSTSVSSSISAGVQTVTPASMSGISTNQALRIDAFPNIEFVVVTGTTGSTFTANFSLAHAGSSRVTDTNCIGPDSDDQIGTVNTWPQAKAVFGSFAKWLTHFGYAPTHIWYLAPASGTANCLANLASGEPMSSCSSNDSTGVEDDPTHPFASFTASGIRSALVAGDGIVMRDGYDDVVNPLNNGSSGSPVLILGYPGEQPNMNGSGTPINAGIYLQSRSWITVDNVRAHDGSECFSGGDSSNQLSAHNFHDIIFRHVYAGPNCFQGLGPISGFSNLTIDSSLFAFNNGPSDQAGVYVGAGCLASTGLLIENSVSHA